MTLNMEENKKDGDWHRGKKFVSYNLQGKRGQTDGYWEKNSEAAKFSLQPHIVLKINLVYGKKKKTTKFGGWY